MHPLTAFLVAAGFVAGATAGPIGERGTCGSDSLANSVIWNQSGEDFTPKKRDLGSAANDESPSLLEERLDMNATSRELDKRSDYHRCSHKTNPNIGVSIDDSRSYAAITQGHQLFLNRQQYYSYTGKKYPKFFRNDEQIADVITFCNNKPVFEFPVYNNGWRFGIDTDNPGTERVIFDSCGNWCATITHLGESNNGFHGCVGYNY
ncbi:hypothetical protein BKA67DRAFT_648993 [Truncatella angustata]|uniref:ribonuclease T1 n=1 Tax=Truncatella angustata TaxID=152316 RepID=A0A9P8ZTN6_9PEZI|nr:uncharacterized protein BKA67DRAFT_648993 [Truncatella angustata]KAH6649070.1 hypothetical protein BKA67DRAFT_648993 [Truncatella angustata]